MRFDAEGHVELAAEILEGDRGGELHELRLGEVAARFREEVVGHLLTRERHRLGEGQRHPLGRRVVRARGKRREITELVFGGAFPQTAGRIDVDSERTAVDERDADVDEGEQLPGQQAGAIDGQ